MSDTKLDAWLRSGKYLPRFMRDFHDQKDVFRAIHETINVTKHDLTKDVSWITGQCYVIDIFLWWMARRGYTLQPARADQDFIDMDDTIRACNERRQRAADAALRAYINRPASGDAP
jgi:hypothetical protein